MKLVFRSQCAITALMLVFGAFSYAQAQSASATPDPFVVQLTSSPAGANLNPFASFAGDISANGRFVVFESNGNLATQNPSNADGNREIFLADYAQRRIFQLTNTKNVQKAASPTPTPTPTPSPTPTPTPTPGPTPADPAQIKIEISNNRPLISFEPALVGGKRIYTIVFSSNAPNPKSFDGTEGSLASDGNQEVWIYQLPEVDDVFDLTSGDDVPFTDLSAGAFRQITNTPPSRPLRTGINAPDIIDDNRDATISDDGKTIAFISTRDLVPAVGSIEGNADFNPELFLARTTASPPTIGFSPGTFAYVQATKTKDDFVGPKTFPRFQQNPSLSANGGVVAFLSTANLALAKTNNDDGTTGDGHGNEEIYVADFTGSGLTNIRQITKTKPETALSNTINVLSAGRRLSRDGAYVAYQSRAEDPTANNGTNNAFQGVFVSKTSDSTFKLVGLRATEIDIINFPTFTDYDPLLAPGALVYESVLNFKADGTLVTDSTGLNVNKVPQIFITQVPVTSANTFKRLTANPVAPLGFTGLRPLASNTRTRIAFSMGAAELGGGNADFSTEVYYLLSPTVSTESIAILSYFTGASNMGPLPTVTPVPSPSPTPTPTPSPSPGVPAGLAPGELSIVQSSVGLANSDKTAVGGSEIDRSPILPVELNGVSVSVGGAAAGLYFVGDSPSEGINFVNPIGLAPGVATFVVNNRGTTYRGFVQIVPAQPDIFTSTNGAGGTAMACNVTNTAVSGCVTGPFRVTSADSTGTQVPTVLQLYVTGVTGTRLTTPTETKVSFVTATGTTDITPTLVSPNTKMFGYDLITFTLPATLAGMAPIDYKIIVTVTKSSVAFTSRPDTTASKITIIP